jgi:PAS domain S-box-containing protein
MLNRSGVPSDSEFNSGTGEDRENRQDVDQALDCTAREFMESAPQAMLITRGTTHVIQSVNQAFCDLMRVGKEDVIGRRYGDVFHEPNSSSPLVLLERAVHSGEATLQKEVVRPRAEGEAVWSYSAWPIRDANGHPLGAVLEISDQTESVSSRLQLESMADQIRAINERLLRSALQEQEWAEKAELASRAKSDFLSMMSHELRTPLTGIVGHTEVLEIEAVGPINERQRDSLGRIKQCSGHLLEMIDDVLNFARMEANVDSVSRQRVDVCQIAREVAALIEPLAAKKGLELHLSLPDVPLDAETDAMKVRQILTNLLSNAVKFTDSGEVRLEVHESDGEMNFIVTDTGIGIGGPDLVRVFEPFVQAERVTTRRFGGTGLGLPISRALATRLGGDLTVKSELGRGSSFSVYLPMIVP